MSNLSNVEIGQQIVALSNAHKDQEAVDSFYDEKVVSIEGQGSGPARPNPRRDELMQVMNADPELLRQSAAAARHAADQARKGRIGLRDRKPGTQSSRKCSQMRGVL